ncbi:hypothetical protein MIR68_000920 [Amoeboaphelidium protococcarum]|nr:hypothetical protein MIR68_000920 [Amoeboaphelidium protococcarum]KAI3652174.1 hypothetical protein MP228_003477 [Amoeboaphelidium protococcarum]
MLSSKIGEIESANKLSLRQFEKDVSTKVQWSVSSVKAAYNVYKLIDNDVSTYWQSDGNQPHEIVITMDPQGKMIPISRVLIYCDWRLDESYCPRVIVVKADGVEVERVQVPGDLDDEQRDSMDADVEENERWCEVDFGSLLQDEEDSIDGPSTADQKLFRCNKISLSIVSNHQNGKDSHIRLIKVYASTLDETRQYEEDQDFRMVDRQVYPLQRNEHPQQQQKKFTQLQDLQRQAEAALGTRKGERSFVERMSLIR